MLHDESLHKSEYKHLTGCICVLCVSLCNTHCAAIQIKLLFQQPLPLSPHKSIDSPFFVYASVAYRGNREMAKSIFPQRHIVWQEWRWKRLRLSNPIPNSDTPLYNAQSSH